MNSSSSNSPMPLSVVLVDFAEFSRSDLESSDCEFKLLWLPRKLSLDSFTCITFRFVFLPLDLRGAVIKLSFPVSCFLGDSKLSFVFSGMGTMTSDAFEAEQPMLKVTAKWREKLISSYTRFRWDCLLNVQRFDVLPYLLDYDLRRKRKRKLDEVLQTDLKNVHWNQCGARQIYSNVKVSKETLTYQQLLWLQHRCSRISVSHKCHTQTFQRQAGAVARPMTSYQPLARKEQTFTDSLTKIIGD